MPNKGETNEQVIRKIRLAYDVCRVEKAYKRIKNKRAAGSKGFA